MGFANIGFVLVAIIAIIVQATLFQLTNSELETRERNQARAVLAELVRYSSAASQCLASSQSPVSLSSPGQTATLTVGELQACGKLGPGYLQSTAFGTPITITAVESTAGVPRVQVTAPIPDWWMPAVQWVAPEFNIQAAGVTLESQSSNMRFGTTIQSPAGALSIDSSSTTPGLEAGGFEAAQ